jgi:hypothetical protein
MPLIDGCPMKNLNESIGRNHLYEKPVFRPLGFPVHFHPVTEEVIASTGDFGLPPIRDIKTLRDGKVVAITTA